MISALEKLKSALLLLALCTCLAALIVISSGITYYAVVGPPKEVKERLRGFQACDNTETNHATKN